MRGENRLYRQKFFERVTPTTLDALWEAGKVSEYPKGHILIRAKEDIDMLWVQLSGKSMLYNLTHTGRRKIIFILGGGAMLNEHVVHEHPASLYCETLEKSEVFSVPLSFVLSCMERDFTLTKAVLETQESRIWRLGHQLKNTQGGIHMERKLAAKLWKLSRDFGVPSKDGLEIDIDMPVALLADLLGTSRETASRMCSFLAEKGLVKVRKKRITITDSGKMSAFYKTGKID